MNDIDGLLLINKHQDITSAKILNPIKKKFKLKKIGHCGTLDPIATGLLMAMIGKATKFSESLMNSDKIYKTVLKLGEETNSYDRTGEIIAKKDYSNISKEVIEKAFNSFIGEQKQFPPMFSAVKHQGKRLYELARANINVERKERVINIKSITIDDISLPFISFTAKVSKGTYIRALCHDVAKKMNTLGHMFDLQRVASGNFLVNNSFCLDDILNLSLEEFRNIIIPINHLNVKNK